MDIEMALWAIEQNRNAEAALVQRRALARIAVSAGLARVVTMSVTGRGARGESRNVVQGSTDVRRSC